MEYILIYSYEKNIEIDIRYSQTLFTIVHAQALSHLQVNIVAKHIEVSLQSGDPFILNIVPFSPPASIKSGVNEPLQVLFIDLTASKQPRTFLMCFPLTLKVQVIYLFNKYLLNN